VPTARSKDHELIGTALRRRRQELRLTIEALAAEADLNPRYVAGVERGETNVALENLLKLTRASDLTLAELCKRAGV
jgi:transcriptional regulator with XRE-family HTH domain